MFFCEIEPFPCALLEHYYPNTPNLGDMTKYKNWKHYDINVLVGGTPCQSYSIAGLRAGLDDPRGNLMLTYLAIADKYRPVWLAWENVPGVLSSGKGRDFGSFLGGLAELGYGFAYRILDAQYFGVPQRRRRVFVVGHSGNWRYAAAVLFERHSLLRNTSASRETGKEITGTITAGAYAGGYSSDVVATGLYIPDKSKSLMAGYNKQDPELETFVATKTNAMTSNGDCHRGFRNGDGLVAYGGQTNKSSIRRLTPVECERLQGFPDNYTLIPYRKKMAADAPRYKALGNSMPVPVMRWIGERIQMVDEIKWLEPIWMD